MCQESHNKCKEMQINGLKVPKSVNEAGFFSIDATIRSRQESWCLRLAHFFFILQPCSSSYLNPFAKSTYSATPNSTLLKIVYPSKISGSHQLNTQLILYTVCRATLVTPGLIKHNCFIESHRYFSLTVVFSEVSCDQSYLPHVFQACHLGLAGQYGGWLITLGLSLDTQLVATLVESTTFLIRV